MTRQHSEYTFEGFVALGQAVAHFRESDKPHWKPVVTTGMSESDIILERRKWSQVQMADIINREFGLTGDFKVSKSAIHRLEAPSINRTDVSLRLIELIANLDLILNPQTGKPYSDAELIAIAKGLLDWRTGEKLNPVLHDSQG